MEGSKKQSKKNNVDFAQLASLWHDILTLGGSFLLENSQVAFRFHGSDIFSRNISFKTEQEARDYGTFFTQKGEDSFSVQYMFKSRENFISFVSSRQPTSIEMGRIFLTRDRPREKEYTNLLSVCRPLVFDVDISDYAEERKNKCFCNGNRYKVCDQCWSIYLTPALKELTDKLTSVFHFAGVLPVFSGRRGFHVWVMDQRTWSYDETERQDLCHSFQTKLDENVTTNSHHLVKLPLVVHPGTGKYAIPIDTTFLPSMYRDPTPFQLTQFVKLIREKIENGRSADKKTK